MKNAGGQKCIRSHPCGRAAGVLSVPVASATTARLGEMRPQLELPDAKKRYTDQDIRTQKRPMTELQLEIRPGLELPARRPGGSRSRPLPTPPVPPPYPYPTPLSPCWLRVLRRGCATTRGRRGLGLAGPAAAPRRAGRLAALKAACPQAAAGDRPAVPENRLCRSIRGGGRGLGNQWRQGAIIMDGPASGPVTSPLTSESTLQSNSAEHLRRSGPDQPI